MVAVQELSSGGMLAAIPSKSRHRILIVGGGTAGITVAARLKRAGERDIALLEPSPHHYYQPLWTLVGAGLAKVGETVRPEANYIPKGVKWIQDAAAELDPARNRVHTLGGQVLEYDFLIICPGIQIDWDLIPGLQDALKTPFVSSNFDSALAPKTWQMIRDFRGGNALFTNPATPIKCGGAPQKIMYLAADFWRRSGVKAAITFGHSGAVIFGVKEFAAVLTEVVARYEIDVHFKRDLVEVRPERREAVFKILGSETGETETLPYDIMHVTPPMSAPDFIKRSPLAVTDSPLGWAKVDKFTLHSPDYPNVFALGDAGSTPNSKTGAAIRAQAPVVAQNLLSVMAGREPTHKYNGYSSCPLVTTHNRVLLAEFDYDMKPAPSIPIINTQKERYDMYLLKRYGLPWMYWNLMLKGMV